MVKHFGVDKRLARANFNIFLVGIFKGIAICQNCHEIFGSSDFAHECSSLIEVDVFL